MVKRISILCLRCCWLLHVFFAGGHQTMVSRSVGTCFMPGNGSTFAGTQLFHRDLDRNMDTRRLSFSGGGGRSVVPPRFPS